MRKGIAGYIVAAALLAAGPAFAHKLSLFAAEDGAVIAGSAKYIPGGPADGITIEVRNGEGQTIGEVTTDGDGRFTYVPDGDTAEFIFTVATPDGHVAEARVTPGASSTPSTVTDDGAALEVAIETQLAPLREDLEVWRGEERRRDWIAAGGMVAGLVGIGLLAAARRRAA